MRDVAPKRRPHRVLVAVLLAIGVLLTPIAIFTLFVHTQVTDTGRYVQNVAPLSADPAVQSYVADDITTRLFAEVDVQAYVRDALPERADVLAGPIATAFEGFVRDVTLRILRSSQFQDLWVAANRAAHAQLVNVLTGSNDGAVVVSSSGVVSLDLSALVLQLEQRLSSLGIDLFSKIPAVKIGAQIPVFQSKDLYRARHAVNALDRVAFVLPFLVFGAFAGAVALSRDRRRGFLAAAIGFAVGALVLNVFLAFGRNVYLDAATSAELPADAAAAVFDTLVRLLHTSIRTALLLSVAVVVAVFFAGPSRLATWFRGSSRSAANWLGAESERAGWTWLSPVPVVVHRKAGLRVAVAVVAFAVLFRWSHPTPAVIAWAAVIVLLALALIEFFGREPVPAAAGSTAGDGTGARPPKPSSVR